jgi:hypothetical protein
VIHFSVVSSMELWVLVARRCDAASQTFQPLLQQLLVSALEADAAF